jgi:D-3-phosphoglycerate dehydrogenase
VESGQVAGAAIDVFSAEPAVGNVLTTSDKIVVTPHLAASTVEAQDRAAISVAEELLDVLDGKPARFAVNAPLVDPETMAVIGPYLDAAELAAKVATQLADGQLERVRIEYLGEIGNHEVRPLRASVIIGMLEKVSMQKVTVVNADALAEQRGIRIEQESGPARDPYANLIVVRVLRADGPRTVAATHTPSGVRVVGIDEYVVDIAPGAAPYVLMVENVDRPGMIGRVGTQLGEWGVNVSFMSVGSTPGPHEHALMVIGMNRALTAEELRTLSGLDNIFSARQIDLT